MTSKTLIDGTAYEIKGGKTLIDNTVYEIKVGRTLVDNTVHEIGFAERRLLIIDSRSSYAEKIIITVGNTGYNGSVSAELNVPIGTVVSIEVPKSSSTYLERGLFRNGVLIDKGAEDINYSFTIEKDTLIMVNSMMSLTYLVGIDDDENMFGFYAPKPSSMGTTTYLCWAETDMTWADWIASSYKKIDYYNDNGILCYTTGSAAYVWHITLNDVEVNVSDKIVSGASYKSVKI